MQAYRLEMGSKFANPRGKDLYAFWGERLLTAMNAELAKSAPPVLINLASEEYFKSLVPRKLQATVIQPVFEEWKAGQYKIVSFYAKRARGLMARHDAQMLKGVLSLLLLRLLAAEDGYGYALSLIHI